MNKSDKKYIYTDFSRRKIINRNGELTRYNNNEALEQAIKIWISSQKGEKIRTTGGGLLVPFIGKTLDEYNAERIKQVLTQGLEEYFIPNITIVELKVIPNNQKNRWEIYVVGYNIELSLGVNTLVLVNNSN